jgi:hypothetical protein
LDARVIIVVLLEVGSLDVHGWVATCVGGHRLIELLLVLILFKDADACVGCLHALFLVLLVVVHLILLGA